SGFAITLDASNNIYITGDTRSFLFPITANAVQSFIGGGDFFLGTLDAFVTKIQSTGASVLYSTYLGGSIDEAGEAIAVDSSGQIYVTGMTTSYDDEFLGGG